MKMPEPVAHCALSIGGKSVAYFDGKPLFMVGVVGNHSHPDPLYTADALRDVLEQAAQIARRTNSYLSDRFGDGYNTAALHIERDILELKDSIK